MTEQINGEADEVTALRRVADIAAQCMLDLDSNLASARTEYGAGQISHGAFNYVLMRHTALHVRLRQAGYTADAPIFGFPMRPLTGARAVARARPDIRFKTVAEILDTLGEGSPFAEIALAYFMLTEKVWQFNSAQEEKIRSLMFGALLGKQQLAELPGIMRPSFEEMFSAGLCGLILDGTIQCFPAQKFATVVRAPKPFELTAEQESEYLRTLEESVRELEGQGYRVQR